MKIIHFLYELKFSGAEIMYVDAAPIFQKLGCELTVVNTAPQLGEYASSFEKAGYKVLHWPYPKSYSERFQYYNKVIKYLKENKYDVVHIHSAQLKWGISYCAWKAGCKAVYTFHAVFKSNWYSYWFHWWLRWSAKNIFKCTFQAISDSVYTNEKNYYHNKTNKVYNWYGSNRFYPAGNNEKETIRKKLNIPIDTLVIISVGGCNTNKRHTDVIKALSYLSQTHPNILYLHLGEGISLKEEQDLVASLDLTDKIRFCGNQTDVRQYLIASDIYVMTSIREGISITTIEAMATQKPAVLYNVPGLRDFNKEKECALLIPEDPEILAQSILKLYKDKELQNKLTTNGKDFVDTHFNIEKNVKQIFDLYKKS